MKCEQYWPDEDTEIEYGDITVKCRSVEEFAEYTVRTCTIVKVSSLVHADDVFLCLIPTLRNKK
jgi:hypothetical protein